MKLIVATREKQGARKNDFHHADEGEIVYFGVECDCETVDGPCGCKRSLVGIKSHKASTTFKVVEKNIKAAELNKMFKDSLVKAGWDVPDSAIQSDVRSLVRLAKRFPLGTVLERRGEVVHKRKERRKER